MPAACRIGDTDITHCSTPARAAGSSKVFVNGIPWSRQGDTNTPHLIPNDDPCSVHAASISTGSSSVFVQKKTPWWLKVAGSFENDPTFDEANRLGQEWRKSAE